MAGRDCSTGQRSKGWNLSPSPNPNKLATSLEHSKRLHSSPVRNALSEFRLLASCSWNPDYSFHSYRWYIHISRPPAMVNAPQGGRRYRYRPFSGNAEVEIAWTRRRPVPPVHRRCHGKGTRGPGPLLPGSLRPSCTLSSG